MIKPISNYIVVKETVEETKLSGGIVISSSPSKTNIGRGEVVSVGTEVEDISVGQTVMFKRFAVDEAEADGQKYLVMKSDEVVAIVE